MRQSRVLLALSNSRMQPTGGTPTALRNVANAVLSTTVAKPYAFTKCYGPARFYRGLWMDMTAQPIEVHLRKDANNLATTAA